MKLLCRKNNKMIGGMVTKSISVKDKIVKITHSVTLSKNKDFIWRIDKLLLNIVNNR